MLQPVRHPVCVICLVVRKNVTMKTARNFFVAPPVCLCLFLANLCANADTIYVACSDANEILKFELGGSNSVFATGLSHPYGLAFDRNSNLYATTASFFPPPDDTILKFDSSGHASVFANRCGGVGGLAFDNSGNLYAVSNGNRIVKIQPDGNGSIFATNAAPYQLYGLAFDNSGQLYVATGGDNTITKFSSNGIGSVFASASLNGPAGLAFDQNGYLYVANYYGNSIVRFDPSGNGSVFASSGLNGPLGLAFDSSGCLYVANCASGTIQKFNPNGEGILFASGLAAPTFIAVQVGDLSAFRINSLLKQENDIQITWTTFRGKTNVVQAMNGDNDACYSNNFIDIGSPIITTGIGLVMTNYTDISGATNNCRYYRVRLVQ